MKRGFVVAVGGLAIVVAGLSGCSKDETKSDSDKASTSAEASSETATASSGASETKVTIDGQDQDVSGTVVCTAMGGNMNIAIGDAATGIAAVVSEDGSNVQSVGLGNVNGVTLGYQDGAGQGEATAEKDGSNWTITGTATGIDMANPMEPVNKPFEIAVVCP